MPSEGAASETRERNGFEHARVTEIQRARMLAAMTEVAAERGAANVTVAHVVARSGVSRRTFYEIFEDGEECFLAAFDEAARCAGEYVLDAYGSAGTWRERIRAGLLALLEFLDTEPFMGRLLVVESPGAGPAALERRRRLLDRLCVAVDEGRREGGRGSDLPELTAEGVVGAVLSVIHARLSSDLGGLSPAMGNLHARPPAETNGGPGQAEGPGRLVDLTSPLMSLIVLPYLGPAAARREAARPRPKRSGRARGTRQDPLQHLGMRLTYRTMRVLAAIAAHPGSSNRHVAEAAGVSDQGQISKLLGRLHALGLIENVHTAPTRGEPNSWRLTGRGQEIERATTKRS